MRIIPVLDLKHGQVVHARAGNREQYLPINTVLCPSAKPADLIEVLISDFKAELIYLADLTALQTSKLQKDLIQDILARFHQTRFMIDAGEQIFSSELTHNKQCLPVIGTETGVSPEQLQTYKNQYHELFLSLDFRRGRLWGNKNILNCTEAWPDKIILMNLDSVGTEQGIDVVLLEKILHLAGEREIYYAGGISNESDIDLLAKYPVSGVLVASALHNGNIKPGQY